MQFFKAHGLGNDYLVLTTPAPLTPQLVRRVCDRHRGVGSDGILEPTVSDRAEHGVRIWNPDGSIAEKSGNGLRIFAFWLARSRAAGAAFTVDTGHDVVGCAVFDDRVEVEMGTARVQPLEGVVLEGMALDVTAVNVGNPHAVIWTATPDLDTLPWRGWGAALEHDLARFPQRTNVQLARSLEPGICEARIWERGAGETLASGSSACAVATVAVERGAQPTGIPIEVRMPGGTLLVTVRTDRSVLLAGPVAPVAHIELDPLWGSRTT